MLTGLRTARVPAAGGWAGLWIAVVAAAAILTPLSSARSQGQTTSARPEANRFTRKVLVDGLDEPMQLEFDRAGRVYFIERKGAVKRYDERTGRVAVLGRIPVAVVGEAGLIGLLLDRDFDRTR
jgi:glucose/arabinose dehydrogenase